MEADFAVAFELQVEEVLAASRRDGAVAPPNTVTADVTYDVISASDLKPEQELFDQCKADVEAERFLVDLRRQFACDMSRLTREEWRKNGYGEGSSSSSSKDHGLGFRVYVKGLVEGTVGGVGVAICDGNDSLLFELTKSLSGNEKDHPANGEMVEFKALIEGLDTAVMLDLKRVTIVTDNWLLYRYDSGRKPPIPANIAALSNQVDLLLRKLSCPLASLVASNDIKFAVELARKAVAGSSNVSKKSSCSICMEDTCVGQMFLIRRCQHSYCYSCMSKHVQFKLLQGILPKCPHESCKFTLTLDRCKKFLSPELFEIMSQRVKEASIPESEKIYCPNPKCSALLSKSELQGLVVGSSSSEPSCRKCSNCRAKFCINCKVPWHRNMKCSGFKRKNPYSSKEDWKMMKLSTKNSWRQCPNCSHMVSLASGCYRISCRCGQEFCYTCGAEYRKKKATCKCPSFDKHDLLYN